MTDQTGRVARLGRIVGALLLAAAASAAAQDGGAGDGGSGGLPSFPDAEGFGATTPGGRGGPVIAVTSLADAGPGTLRAALQETEGPRIVIFAVEGEIALTDEIVVGGQATVLGHVAPGAGVTITGARLRVAGDDVILRGLRIRPGDGPGQNRDDRDAISIGDRNHVVRRVVVDRNSLTWATDENLALWWTVEDVTLSNNLIAEALLRAGHSQVRHSTGLLVGGGARRVSIHGNLLASNFWRNPQIHSAQDIEFVNNLVVNPGPEAFASTTAPTTIDVINNVFVAGPATPSPRDRAAIGLRVDEPGVALHVSGNATPMGPDAIRGPGLARLSPQRVVAPSGLTVRPTGTTRARALALAGARAPTLDPVDARILAEAAAGRGRIIDSPAEVGGLMADARTPAPVREADRDGDGVPDAAELRLGSDPDVADSHLAPEPGGYVWIERYAETLWPQAR